MKDKLVNPYMRVQIMNEIMEVDNFLKLLLHAAKRDDGEIDAIEEEVLKKIDKASKKYVETLRSTV